MRIAVIGTGYVGLVSGACFSEFGTSVVCVDKDASKIERINRGEMPIYEPGLDDLVARNVKEGRLEFSTDLAASVKGVDAVFIAVGTPSRRGDGHADLSYVFAAAEEIAKALDGYAAIVTKSTVPVGTGRKVAEVVMKARPDLELGRDFDVVSNPEFLREGSAIEDFMRPDRVVVGTLDGATRGREVMRALYRPLALIEKPVLFTALETAEVIKYAANCFLATKITFINEMANLCEQVGADVQDVAKGIGLDNRIGNKFLHAGPGYGGSCFPKDCLALVKTARDAGAPIRIVESVIEVNEGRKVDMARRIVDALGGDAKGKRVGLLGLTFKPNTDDMRDSPSLAIVPALLEAGASIRAYDPEGMHEAQKLLSGIEYAADAYDALKDADVLVFCTEWNQFRSLDWTRVRQAMPGRIIVDLRNIYDPTRVAREGFTYHSIGRKAAIPA
ncbi:UDP-glucose 6-dehydrogenase [Aliidongia dinghuensis]|uniref:UDP-glucose 6-dehydrogenase n=1 Tax=Aliidongia dinghuensis TaxID=1867774 RepID=A0A8J3E5T7_9PROT|nr:UDP-glucose/GDP-mannose dehydrogenase family protein [Aliidongia dinghuensis]GGF38508.1 UDP-glucose 6-dehydrogenase [Aliidongia dinghuensis]